MRERIIKQCNQRVDADDVTIIYNWEDKDFIEPRSKDENHFSQEHGLVEPFTVLYSGNIGQFHDLETLVDAATAFEEENVRFLIIGEGDDKQTIIDRAESLGVRGDTVRFLPYQPWDALPFSLTSGDVSVVTVKEGFEGVCVSSKLHTAMAAGMPILGIVQPDDDEARLIDRFDAGIQVEQGNVGGVVEAIERWRSDINLVNKQGMNARTAFENHFTKDQSVDRYYRLLTDQSVRPYEPSA
jgi:glycosyltransferase involved in cell wall biosynthesis